MVPTTKRVLFGTSERNLLYKEVEVSKNRINQALTLAWLILKAQVLRSSMENQEIHLIVTVGPEISTNAEVEWNGGPLI